MVRISELEVAILGLLYEHHHYAYRLEEIIEKRAMLNWADLEYSSMESVLEKLEEKNLVENEIRKIEGQPSRNIYSITDEGKFVFREKIKELMSKNSKVVYPFDLAIANMNFLSYKEIIQSLKLYLKSLEERIEFIDNSIKIQEENNVPYNFIAIFSRSSALLKAEKRWIEEFIEEIKEMEIYE
ncbi:MAG: PadR family transcriptional regulator [Methanobacterium sp.]|uniref:PadR family transcriptional regulator n=1 Tax=Methanobacterium sp. TaxID=2164 RepID=UPI003D646D14|nr:PadR family transcriptional regulator [Methanobacterium sp.]